MFSKHPVLTARTKNSRHNCVNILPRTEGRSDRQTDGLTTKSKNNTKNVLIFRNNFL